MLAIFDTAKRDPEVRAALGDQDSLVIGGMVVHDSQKQAALPAREERKPGGLPRFDPALRSWTLPFFMGSVNSRVVRRSNALAGFPLGSHPDYCECIAFGKGMAAVFRVGLVAAAGATVVLSLLIAPARWLLKRLVLPKPGQGPGVAVRGEGSFELTVRGYKITESGQKQMSGGQKELPRHTDASGLHEVARVRVSSDRDPGYGAAAIMISECALLLARGTPPSGFHTPASALGRQLADVLSASGVCFEVVRQS